jgi:hypothetical protein
VTASAAAGIGVRVVTRRAGGSIGVNITASEQTNAPIERLKLRRCIARWDRTWGRNRCLRFGECKAAARMRRGKRAQSMYRSVRSLAGGDLVTTTDKSRLESRATKS